MRRSFKGRKGFTAHVTLSFLNQMLQRAREKPEVGAEERKCRSSLSVIDYQVEFVSKRILTSSRFGV